MPVGKIYVIRSKSNPKIYIGSTAKKYLATRLADHAYRCRQFDAGKSKSECSAFELLRNNDYSIHLIEEFEYRNKKQLFEREGYHIHKNKGNCVNENKRD